MTLFLLSLLGLGVGPLLDRFARQRATVIPLLEGFVAATILGLVFGHILPEAVEVSGWLCLPVAAVGLVAPQILEHRLRSGPGGIHGIVAAFALAGLFLHTLLDGAALATSHRPHADAAATALGIGVVLHRLPVGLTVWWLVRRAAGTLAAVAAIITIGVGTGIGFLAGEAVVERLDTVSVALFQAFVASGLVHVVLHQSLAGQTAHDTPRAGWFTWSGLGALSGAAVLLVVPLSGHQAEEHLGVAAAFLAYWLTAAPYLLAGLATAALLKALRARRPNLAGWPGLLLDVALGSTRADGLLLATPDPARVRGRFRSVLWLAAVPVAGADVVLLSVPMLGIQAAVLRLGAVLLLAVVSAAVVAAITIRGDARDPAVSAPAGHGAGEAYGVIERSLPWILIGLVSATFLDRFMPAGWMAALPDGSAVAGMALLGALISVPSVAALPIAVPLIHKGLPLGAAIAFLATGPVVTASARGWLSGRHGRACTGAFAAAAVCGAVVLGLLSDALFPNIRVPHPGGGPSGTLRTACGIAAGLLVIWTVLRLGPGGMVAQLGTHAHHHDHD